MPRQWSPTPGSPTFQGLETLANVSVSEDSGTEDSVPVGQLYGQYERNMWLQGQLTAQNREGREVGTAFNDLWTPTLVRQILHRYYTQEDPQVPQMPEGVRNLLERKVESKETGTHTQSRSRSDVMQNP